MSIYFILLINVKMATNVGIWTFISRIEGSENKRIVIFQYLRFYELKYFSFELGYLKHEKKLL